MIFKTAFNRTWGLPMTSAKWWHRNLLPPPFQKISSFWTTAQENTPTSSNQRLQVRDYSTWRSTERRKDSLSRVGKGEPQLPARSRQPSSEKDWHLSGWRRVKWAPDFTKKPDSLPPRPQVAPWGLPGTQAPGSAQRLPALVAPRSIRAHRRLPW